GVLVTDDHSVITLFNQSAQNILDLEHRDVIGKSLDDFTGLFGHAAQTWMDTIRNWSEDPTSFEIGDTYTDQITLDNQRVVSIHLAPVAMRNEFLGSVSTFRDITHQVEVDRLKSEFVATVSHELRTPMTSIKGYVDVLLMGAAGDLSTQQSNFLDIVKINTERLNILVNDLLDVSRIEAGKVELAIQPLDMRLLIEEVVREQVLRAEKEGKPMSIHYDLPPNLPRVPGDEERVRQILDNLVINAYQYTPGEGQIDIRLQVHPAEIQVDIQDNGIGIPPADHEKIFERFYRGEDPLVLASGGNGLGLSIVRQITDMHHGRLWLTSEGIPGKGSTFSFTLPLHHPQEEVL
ncbi:MAG: cell wall metabolism sensor histidine kinase WalK, partial [Anaerolineales bacterium]|nr:cell wall metabolism sensor histidine kinase WalK [Anaerolineales bacterium]